MVRYIFKWTANLILVLAVLLAIIGLILPALFSSRAVIVYSGSMEPALPVGCIVIISSVDPASVNIGDVLAFHPPDQPDITIAHRVIEISNADGFPTFRTKGDANNSADTVVTRADNLVGRVTWHMPYIGYGLGWINHFVRTIWGLSLLVILPTLIILYSTIREILYPPTIRQRRMQLMAKRRQQWRSHNI